MVKVFKEKNLVDKLVESRRADERRDVLFPHCPHSIFPAVTKKCLNVSDEASYQAPTARSNNSDILAPALV